MDPIIRELQGLKLYDFKGDYGTLVVVEKTGGLIGTKLNCAHLTLVNVHTFYGAALLVGHDVTCDRVVKLCSSTQFNLYTKTCIKRYKL